MKLKSGDTEIFYTVRGRGAPVVLLHPFPANHGFWDECAPHLENRYRLIIPDLRGHGASPPGEGVATMHKHAGDLLLLCHELAIGKAAFAGVSIGGYILFELWRQARERVSALILANTRAGADSAEQRANREKSIQDVHLRGPAPFIEATLPKVLSKTTLQSRHDRVDVARRLMAAMSVQGIAACLRGMAARPDSTPTLKTIDVPTLVIGGEEDVLTPRAEAELMHTEIGGSRLEMVPNAGHFAALEQPEYVARILRGFLDGAGNSG
jgi:3-oxoadipate enol-lactonase